MGNNSGAMVLWVVLLVSAFLLIGLGLTRKRKGGGLIRLLLPPVLGLCLCIVGLCGTSWAWFCAARSAQVAKTESAFYAASVVVLHGETALTANPIEDGGTRFDLEANQEYRITIIPGGTAQRGYCRVRLGDRDYYTGQLTEGTLSFTVYADRDMALTVLPQWGICTAANEENTIVADAAIGTKPAEDMAPTAPAGDAAESPENTAPAAGDPEDHTPTGEHAVEDTTPTDTEPDGRGTELQETDPEAPSESSIPSEPEETGGEPKTAEEPDTTGESEE